MGCLRLTYDSHTDLRIIKGGKVLTSEKSVLNARKYKEARLYDADVARFLSLDPLAKKYPSFSPYCYVAGNPIIFIDPTGKSVEDVIKIGKNGSLTKTVTTDNFDVVTNEDGSKSQKFEKNTDGSSKFGDINTMKMSASDNQGNKSDTYTYMQINDSEAAKGFFEFAASNSNVEFGLDNFSFADGFETNMLFTNQLPGMVASSGGNLSSGYNLSFGQSGPYHLLGDATWNSNTHSHPSSNFGTFGPSGFNGTTNAKGGIDFTPGLMYGDRSMMQQSNHPKNAYMFNPNMVSSFGGGYVKYDSENATFIGNK